MIRLLSFIAATTCFASSAEAFVNIPASGCVPDRATIRDNRALVGNASVRHAPGVTDPIVLTCAMPNFTLVGDPAWSIRITYVDSNGAASNAFVSARLYRMAIGDDEPDPLATVNSNGSSATDLHTRYSVDFDHTFNFNTDTYWFHVELDRGSTGQNVILHSVSLIPIFASDVRLKHSIALLGRLANGLGFYRFSYHGSDKAYVGVMAQEVEAIRPNAVVRDSFGYLGVAYDLLGLRMQTWEEWVDAGARIPTTTP